MSPNPLAPTLFALKRLGMCLLIGTVITNCGGGDVTPLMERQLVALAVEPANADAVAPGGTAPFSATGTFNQSPSTQTNLPAQWTSSDATIATVDSSTGIATCVATGGPVTISASAAGKGGSITGTAALTCVLAHSGLGRCLVSAGGAMNGSCIGERGGLCHQAYDPANCPPGEVPAAVTSDQCGPSTFNVDAGRTCTP